MINRSSRLARFALFAFLLASGSSLARDKAITKEDREHWAFTPPRDVQVPRVKETGWVRNPIDAFVLAELETNELAHAPEADRSALLRRVTFDLTGLPPTPRERDAFLSDRSANAYEKVVDRLLASPQYGERWAQHWLDLARYADTDGYEFDQARPDAWRYRDWVVQALNRDMPYDRFIKLQLAGDEFLPDDSSAFIATGFNRCYPDMVDLNDQGLRRQNALNDITETTGLVFLGLTIGCARCHDHKFDPIRQTDFYSLQAFFTPARFRDDYPIASARDRAAHESKVRDWEREIASVQNALIELECPVREVLTPDQPRGLNDEMAAAFQKPATERSPLEVGLVYEALLRDRRIRPAVWGVVLDPMSRAIRRVLQTRLTRLQRSRPAPLPGARGLDEKGPNAPPTYFLTRGEFTARGPEVVPAIPAVLGSGDATSLPITPSDRSSGRRRALAEWLVQPGHPLTARVMVNRLWQHHFGRGIVATPSDFGTMGEEPSHPALLDWLALEFTARGWSLKAMHRLMVTSAAYRQSTRLDPKAVELDPDNTLVWRQHRQRLDGEALRDALLAVAGELNPAMGGPCVFPELPAELTKLSSKGAVWPVSARLEDRRRRSLYVFVRRNLRYPFFEAFDRPDTNVSCPRRAVTTIAPQALTLLNSQVANQAAHGLAARVVRTSSTDHREQICQAFRLAFARDPDQREAALALEFLSTGGSLEQLCLAMLNGNEFLYID